MNPPQPPPIPTSDGLDSHLLVHKIAVSETQPLLEQAYRLGKPTASAVFKQQPEDFLVEEILGFEGSGSGEHVLLQVEKRDLNTQAVKDILAKFANIPARDVGHSGLKDKYAVAKQWLSLRMAGKTEPEWQLFDQPGLKLLQWQRHHRKLKPGTHKLNRFVVKLRNVKADFLQLEQRLLSLMKNGFPNYFGEQRFGQQQQNLVMVRRMLAGKLRCTRQKRSIYLSTLRAYVFNQLLSARLNQGLWDQAMMGDVLQLAGKRSVFALTELNDDMKKRLQDADLHITGPLIGAGEKLLASEALLWEQKHLHEHADDIAALMKIGMDADRRSLRAIPKDLVWQQSGDELVLEFQLETGCYATSLLRELFITNNEEE